MTISYVGVGSSGTGTTSVTPGIPSGIVSGDLLKLSVAYKYGGTATVNTPSGWTAPSNNQAQGGTGTGVDNGVGAVAVFYYLYRGDEGWTPGSTTVTVSITSGNSVYSRITAYHSDKTIVLWDVACAQGGDGTAGTAWSVTGNTDQGVVGGDWVIASSGVNTDAYSWSAEAITQTGVTWGTETERFEFGATQGDDCELIVSTHEASSGTSSAAGVFTMTSSGTATGRPVGGTVMMRIRDGGLTDEVNLFAQESVVITQTAGDAQLFAQEVLALTQTSGDARLFAQEIVVITADEAAGETFETGSAALTFAAQTPTVTTGVLAFATGAAALTFTAQPPTVTGGATSLTTGSAGLTFAAQVPTVFGSAVSLTTGAAALTFAAQAPTIATGVAFETGSASLTFAAQAPTVTTGPSTFTTGSASLTFTAQPPTLVSGAVTVGADSADLFFAAQAPTVTAGAIAFDTGAASLVFGAQAPAVSVSDVVATGSGLLRFGATAVDVFYYDPVLVAGSAPLVFTAQPPESVTFATVVVGEVAVTESFQGDAGETLLKRRRFDP